MIGARCRTIQEYYDKNKYTKKKYRDRLGTIKGQSLSNRCWWILWDGNKTIQLSNKRNVEIVPDEIKLEQIANQLTEINNFYDRHTSTTNIT